MTVIDLTPGKKYFYATDTAVQTIRYQSPDYEDEGVQSGRHIFRNVQTRHLLTLIPTELQRLFTEEADAIDTTRQQLFLMAERL